MIGVGELKAYLGLGAQDEADTALLEHLEREELAAFERRTNRYFGPVAELVEVLSVRGRHLARFRHADEPHRGSPRLHLRAPIVSLTQVEVLGAATLIGGTGWSEPWPLSAFEVADNRVTLIDGSVFPAGLSNVRITYQGGYTAGQEPYDVRGAIKQRVANRYRERHQATEDRVAPPLVASADAAEAAWRRNPGL